MKIKVIHKDCKFNLKSCSCPCRYIQAHAMCSPSIKNQVGIHLNKVIVAANLKQCRMIKTILLSFPSS